ncbi:MAG: ATP-binding cassette domain-containing protein [Spirochaetaceae bacterium]|jgi:ABC-2 type transport system ATP-binding protein|nr:ATP-binding cassette domain-containing protein [Spirochaetaceae bacterium]
MIEVQNVSKLYGAVQAVKDVSFFVEQDQVLGFLGPNGAGKTTIMKMLTGYHYPSAGKVLVNGLSVEDEPKKVKRLIGYLPESVPLYGDLTVKEYLTFASDGRRITGKPCREAIARASEACGIVHMAGRKIETLSKGYKQRVGLAQAILHDPPILILDEPTTGLDPNQIIEIRALITELGKRKTVILSTHILQEVEAVCSRVLILNEGRIAAQGTTDEIAGTLKGGQEWELRLKGADAASLKKRLAALGVRVKVGAVEDAGDGAVRCGFSVPGKSHIDGERIFDWAVTEGFKIIGMTQKRLSLEDIFVRLTGDAAVDSSHKGHPEAAPQTRRKKIAGKRSLPRGEQ